MAAVVERLRALDEPLEPRELVVELRSRLRIAVRQVQASDDDAVRRRLEITALLVGRIPRQAAVRLHGLRVLREDRHTVPRLLPVPDRAVARLAQVRGRKARVDGLQLL